MTPPKVFIADSISQRGIDELTRDGALEVNVQTGLSETDLAAAIPDFAALIVRSQTKVTSKILNAAKKLRVVGRAGVGVDNVDVETATRRGVVVLNAPGAIPSQRRSIRFRCCSVWRVTLRVPTPP